MPAFQIKSIDKTGKRNSFRLNFSDEEQLARKLRESGITPIRISKVHHGPFERFWESLQVSKKEIIQFTSQLHVMLNSGIPIFSALQLFAETETNPTFKEIIKEITHSLFIGGISFSQALGLYPAVFSPVYINSIAAGEQGGFLPEVLKNLGDYLEEEDRMTRRIKQSLTYPFFTFIAGLAVISIMFLYVFPKLANLFSSMGIQLPWITMILIEISRNLFNPWVLLAILTTVLISAWILRIIFASRSVNTQKYFLLFDTLLCDLPVLGKVKRYSIMARFTRITGYLYSQGIPLLTSVQLANNACANRFFEKKIIKPLMGALREGGNFSDIVVDNYFCGRLAGSLISTGELTGDFAEMLLKTAQYLDSELSGYLTKLLTYLEPMIILFLGVFVGFVVISGYYPIYTLIMKIK